MPARRELQKSSREPTIAAAMVLEASVAKSGLGPKSLALGWLQHWEMKVFVSLCSNSTGRCMGGLKVIRNEH